MKNKLLSGMKSFFKTDDKKEQQTSQPKLDKVAKLPTDFANRVLDYELLVDSGCCDIETVEELMKLYS